MQSLALLSIVPLIEIIIMGAILTRDTCKGGWKWPEWRP